MAADDADLARLLHVHRRVGGLPRPGPARPGPRRMTPIEAWSAVVAGEDAAVYAYSVAGARCLGRRAADARSLASTRIAPTGSRAAAAVVAAGGTAPPAAAALRAARRHRHAARRHARLMADVDTALVATYADAAAAASGDDRRWAARTAADCAVRAVVAGAPPRRRSRAGLTVPSPTRQPSRSQPRRRMSTPDDREEDEPHELAPPSDRHPGADDGADDVARAHEQPEQPQHRAGHAEHDDGGQVRPEVDDLRGGRGVQERVAEHADQHDQQERAGARADEAVVEADGQSGDGRDHVVAAAARASAAAASGPSAGLSSVHTHTHTSSTTMTGGTPRPAAGSPWRRRAPRRRRRRPPSAARCARPAAPCGVGRRGGGRAQDARRPCSSRAPRRVRRSAARGAGPAAAAGRRRR